MHILFSNLIFLTRGRGARNSVGYAQQSDAGVKLFKEVQSRVKAISTEELKKIIDTNQDFILLAQHMDKRKQHIVLVIMVLRIRFR